MFVRRSESSFLPPMETRDSAVPLAPAPRCSSCPMGIRHRRLGQVDVQHPLDISKVDAARDTEGLIRAFFIIRQLQLPPDASVATNKVVVASVISFYSM